jgi:hypothetical protein
MIIYAKFVVNVQWSLDLKKTQYTILNFTYGPDIIIFNCNLYSEGRLRTKLYEKRDDLNFYIMNFSFICSNIPAAPAYSVHISKLIRYSRACGSCMDFLDIWLPLTRQLLNHWFLLVKLKTSLRNFTVVKMTWLTAMEYLCHKWVRICSTCRKHFPVISSLTIYHHLCN